jgi:hypothetical protein
LEKKAMTISSDIPPFTTLVAVTTDARVRVARGLFCPCGRQLNPHDVDTFDGNIRLICTSCHDLLLEIEPLSSNE